MKKIIIWLILIFLLLVFATYSYTEKWFILKPSLVLPFKSAISAGFGGILYLMRAVYVNKCVNNRWGKEWEIWYYIRPFTSLISGIASFIFLKAGVLILSADIDNSTSSYGFMAVAFIAGLNVDKFTLKLEDLAKATWGVEKSGMNRDKTITEKNNKDETTN